MDCSPPGSSIQGIFQARILEWFAISFPMEFSQSGDQTYISCVGRWISIHCTTREVPVFLTIIAMLHVTALELIHLTAESLYSWPISAFPSLPHCSPAPLVSSASQMNCLHLNLGCVWSHLSWDRDLLKIPLGLGLPWGQRKDRCWAALLLPWW